MQKYCPKCKEVRNDFFCSICGTKLVEIPTTNESEIKNHVEKHIQQSEQDLFPNNAEKNSNVLIVPEGTTVINRHDFFEHRYEYRSIILPSTLKKIGIEAFLSFQFHEIVIPEGVTDIEQNAFSQSWSLRSVTLPSTLKKIGASAFSDTGLEAITIPEGITEIKRYTFAGCSLLKSVTLPSTLKTIGASAFANTGLEEIIIPDSVMEIKECAFFRCYSLQSIQLPDTLPKIDASAFEETDLEDHFFLKTENEEDKNYEAGEENDCENEKNTVKDDSKKNHSINSRICDEHLIECSIPDGVKEITNNTVENWKILKTITLPISIQNIDECVFSACKELIKINIPMGTFEHFAKMLPKYWFLLDDGTTNNKLFEIMHRYYGDTSLMRHIHKKNPDIIVVEYGASEIKSREFEQTNASFVLIPPSVEFIRRAAFFNSNIKMMFIPESVHEIETAVFACCSELEFVYLPSNTVLKPKKGWLDIHLFSSNRNLKQIIVPKGTYEKYKEPLDKMKAGKFLIEK